MEDIKVNETVILPCIALSGIVLFPDITLHFSVEKGPERDAVDSALETEKEIFVVKKDDEKQNNNRLCSMGCAAKILQVTEAGDGSARVAVTGLYRAKLLHSISLPAALAEVRRVSCEKLGVDRIYETALVRYAKNIYREYITLKSRMYSGETLSLKNLKSSGALADFLAFHIVKDPDFSQTMLEETRPVERLLEVTEYLNNECSILKCQKEIDDLVRRGIDENQRDYYLREQLRVISDELGESDSPLAESENYINKIKCLGLEKDTEDKLLKEAERLGKMPFGSQEATVSRNYLDTVLELPWNKKTKEKTNVAKARKVLDRDHYGLEKVKERILEILSVKQLDSNVRGQIICLAGPPGVGKTSVAKSLAEAMNRKYQRVSLGGVRDEAEIRGHRKTYIGSMPGRIISAVSKAGTNNPLILLDEIDKLASDVRGDPASALLEALDPEQNSSFEDHYIDVPFDLSDVLFITTANNCDTIPAPLLDRMEVIELSSYTREEKFQIAKRHLISKQLKANGLCKNRASFSSSAIYELIDFYTREAGVRKLESAIASLCRKAAKEIVEGKSESVKFTEKNIPKYLGVRKFKRETVEKVNRVGVVHGLAWTSAGGEMLEIESAFIKGSGKIILTGSLGDVMKESATAAVSYIRQISDGLENADPDFYKNRDIHIHAPEGAVPKDGPSAGITMAVSLVSALTGIPVKGDISMTGEISLRGRVLPIGGLNEKSMAAYKNGIKKIIIPADNCPDIEEIQPILRENISFIPVSGINEVLKTALEKSPFKTDEGGLTENCRANLKNPKINECAGASL